MKKIKICLLATLFLLIPSLILASEATGDLSTDLEAYVGLEGCLQPGTITLSASTGSSSGAVNLSWSAPSPVPTTIEIKYSSSAITADNYSSATTATSILSGTATSYTVSGLTAGNTFYFAVKGYAGATCVSDISSLPSAQAYQAVISGGGAPIIPTTTTGQVTATAVAGGKTTLSLPDGTKATVEVPAGAVTSNTAVKIEKVETGTIIVAAPTPTGQTIVSAFNFTATAADGTAVTSFAKNVTITITYTDAQITGLDESNLKIYRWTGTQWVILPSTVNTATNTITATTTSFSYFAVISGPTVTAEQLKAQLKAQMIELIKQLIVLITQLIAQLQAQLAAAQT